MALSARFVAAVAALVLFASPARADTPGVTWEINDPDHYYRRAAVAWDLDRNVVVTFGGSGNHYDESTAQGALHQETMELGLLWRTRHLSDSQFGPRKRMAHAMAYDTTNKRTMLYGGDTRIGEVLPPVIQLLADTWFWDGNSGTWSRQCDACGPGPLAGHAMVYDEARKRAVLFGGMTARYPAVPLDAVSGATWEHDGTAWIPRCGTAGLAACGPLPRTFAGMAYDVARARTVLFGGRGTKGTAIDGYGESYDDTWEWDGATWTARCGATAGMAPCGPGARYEHGMAYHRARERTAIVFGVHDVDPGGADAGPPPVSLIHQDVWEWDGAQWSPVCGTPAKGTCGSLAGRAGLAATYRVLPAPERHAIDVFGGHNLLPSNLVHYTEDVYYEVSGACTTQKDCDIGSCVDGVCCSTSYCHVCERCLPTSGALGRCAPVKNADHPSCKGTCDENAVCRGKKGATACRVSDECVSNVCADGVCCDRPCDAACEACSVAKGSGVDGTCGPVAAGTPGRSSCEGYVCNGRDLSCPSSCTTNADCIAPQACIETSPGHRTCVRPPPCASRERLRRDDGTEIDCAPYVCAAAACKATCATVTDCAVGNVCRIDHTCGPLPSDVDEGGSCTVAMPGMRSSATMTIAIVAGFWALRRRRRARGT